MRIGKILNYSLSHDLPFQKLWRFFSELHFIFSNFFTFQNLWKPFLTWRWNFGKKQLYFYVMVTWSHAKTFLQNISFKKFYFLSLEEDNKKGHKMCQMALNLEGRLCWCWCQPKRPLLHEHAQANQLSLWWWCQHCWAAEALTETKTISFLCCHFHLLSSRELFLAYPM